MKEGVHDLLSNTLQWITAADDIECYLWGAKGELQIREEIPSVRREVSVVDLDVNKSLEPLKICWCAVVHESLEVQVDFGYGQKYLKLLSYKQR